MAERGYRFRSEWALPASADQVYGALEDLGSYPTWWPEVRRTEQIDDATARVTCRSLLPYDLVFTTAQSRRDRDARVLEATMRGDLEGFSRWTIRSSATGSVAVFEEEVDVTKPLLRRLEPIARPAFVFNHWLMMRHGRDGLTTFLAD